MRHRLILPLVLLALAPMAEARDLTGQMAYRERIALPEGATLRVELRGAGGIAAEVQVDPEGRQVPLPFAIAAPDTGDYVLQGAIFVGAQPEWVSAPVAVTAGEGPLDLGLIEMTRHVAMGFMSRMRCGAEVIEAGYLDDSARIRVRGETLVLPQAMSASGARFADGATPETEFWNKGVNATLTLRGQTLPLCVPMIDGPLLPLTARGNEPFWRLDLTPAGFAYEAMGAARIEGALPPPAEVDEGVRFAVNDALSFTVMRGLCRDTMTGMPHPLTVTVADKDAVQTGCAGRPGDLLAGSWTVREVAGSPVAEDVAVTMEFDDAATRVSGSGGCNRYNAEVELGGEGLSFGPAMSTMMACPEPQMAAEQAFHKALAGVDRFDIGEDGGLTLFAAGQPVIRAAR